MGLPTILLWETCDIDEYGRWLGRTNAAKMTFCKMKMKTRDCTFILQNENENGIIYEFLKNFLIFIRQHQLITTFHRMFYMPFCLGLEESGRRYFSIDRHRAFSRPQENHIKAKSYYNQQRFLKLLQSYNCEE